MFLGDASPKSGGYSHQQSRLRTDALAKFALLSPISASIQKISCHFLFPFRNFSYLCTVIFVEPKFKLLNDMNELSVITTKDVEEKLISLRNQKVLLDCDVADLYGVKTKRLIKQ